MWKVTWCHKTFEEHGEIRKKIFTCELFDYLHVHWLWTWKKDKVQVPQQNEMLNFYCTALGFINKNEEYNPE